MLSFVFVTYVLDKRTLLASALHVLLLVVIVCLLVKASCLAWICSHVTKITSCHVSAIA